MAANITTYPEQSIQPITTITWVNVLTILKAAHNVRFCASPAVATTEIQAGSGNFSGDSVVIDPAFPFVIGSYIAKFKLDDPLKKYYVKANNTMPGCHYTTYDAIDRYLTGTTPTAATWAAVADSLTKTTGALIPAQRQEIATDLAHRLLDFFDNALATDHNQKAMVLLKPVLTNPMTRVDFESVTYGHLGKMGAKHSDASWYSKQMYLVHGHNMDKAVREQQKGRCLAALVMMAGHIAAQH